MKYNIKQKKLKQIDRRKLRQFKIQTKYRLMKTLMGGNEKYKLQINKNN